MKFVQYYLDCLSQASYLIGDDTTGRPVVVESRRDVQEYLDDAADAGLQIAYIIETHLHADFLSGHLELAEATGATVVYGPAADVRRGPSGPARRPRRNAGGHGPAAVPVGPRPAARAPDDTRVYPAHGPGSACGKNLSTAKVSTIGEQRCTNYALRLDDADQFVQAITEGQPPRPDYFTHVAELNREPHQLLLDEAPAALTLHEVISRHEQGAAVLDVRLASRSRSTPAT